MRVLYIDIDSCRADHLGCYSYHRHTSPVIDELARHSTRFTNCHTSDAPCLPSRAALFSGRFGINNGVTCHDGPASQLRYPGRGHRHDPSYTPWMRCFQQAGWQTVCFSGFAQRHLAWWYSAGFTQFFGNQLPGGAESADEVNAAVIPWLRTHGTGDNWFMHINYWDVHHPYQAPQPYFERVSQFPAPNYPNAATIEEHAQTIYGPCTARDWWAGWGHEPWTNPLEPETAQMPLGNPDNYETYLGFLNGHDAGIAYVDEKIGDLLEELEQLGIRDETAIIISTDHGESIGELGMYFEHGNCCEGTTRVPLIVHWPEFTEAEHISDGLIYQLDLPPTILDLLGIEIPIGWDGISYAATVRGEPQSARSHLVLGCGIYCYQRAVRTPQHRLIRTIHPGLYPYEPLYLFDMQTDPNQTASLAQVRPDVVAELDHLLLDWGWQYTTGAGSVRDPFQEQLAAGVDPDLYCSRERMEQRLIDLGRDDQLADLRRRRDKWPSLPPR
jgi:choline-sulfatase